MPSKSSRIHILLKCTWNILKTDHILGYKSNLSNFKKIEIISSILSDHNTMGLEINNKKKSAKNTNMWRLNNMLLNNQWITEEIKEEM